jgi:hypothetical protein
MHDECAKHFLLLNYCMMIPIIFMSTSSGAINLTGVRGYQSTDVNYVALALGIIGLGTAGLSTLQNVLKYGERSISHKESAKAFETLSRDISVEIILENTESKTYVNFSLQSLMNSARLVPSTNSEITIAYSTSQREAFVYKYSG